MRYVCGKIKYLTPILLIFIGGCGVVFEAPAEFQGVLRTAINSESLVIGKCSDQLSLESVDASGNLIPQKRSFQVQLKSDDVNFYATDECLETIEQVDFLAGEDKIPLYSLVKYEGALSIGTAIVDGAKPTKVETLPNSLSLNVATPVKAQVKEISIDSFAGCAIVLNEVRCWSRSYGIDSYTVKIGGLGSNLSHLDLDQNIACVVDEGAAKCWAPNSTQVVSATVVPTLGSGVVDVNVGYQYGCAAQNGGVKCWGSQSEGRLGDGVDNSSGVLETPIQTIAAGNGIVEVEVSDEFGCAMNDTGSVYCWGRESAGRLGRASYDSGDNYQIYTPELVAGIANAKHIGVGDNHACAVLADGTVKCWGSNSEGRLGNGDSAGVSSSAIPLSVTGFTSNLVEEIAVSRWQSCARSGTKVFCWGSNYAGSLGMDQVNDSMKDVATPAFLGMPSPIKRVFYGSEMVMCVLLENQDVYCVGLARNNSFNTSETGNVEVVTPQRVRYLFPSKEWTTLTLSKNSIMAGVCTPIQLEARDDYKDLRNVSANLGVALSHYNESVQFYSDSQCFNVLVGNVNIPSGKNKSNKFYIRSTVSSNYSMAHLEGAASGVYFGDRKLDIVPAAASKVSGTVSDYPGARNGSCNYINVSRVDSFGNRVALSTPTIVGLTSNSVTGQFFSDSYCMNPITQVTVDSDLLSKQVYFLAIDMGASVDITFTDLTASGSILSASTVNKASEADEFAAAFNYPSVGNTRPDVCNLVSLVGRSDSYYTAAFDSSFSVSISVGIDAGTVTAYSDSNCINITSNLSINAGTTGEKFWIKTSGQPVGYTSGTISGSGGGYSYYGSFGVNVP